MIEIDGKTLVDMQAMTSPTRSRWYQTLDFVERGIAMEMVETARRAKQSVSMTGENNPMKRPEARARMRGESNPMYGKTHFPEARAKMTGENSPFFGKTHSPETRAKKSAAMMGEKNPMYGISKTGENAPNWKDGSSYDPYCHLFNEERREHIRNLCGRVCTICGRSTLQNVNESGWWFGRLAVDHLDEEKMQGCDDWEWRLTALCVFCHGRMQKQEHHLLLQLLLVNNKRHQTSLLFASSSARAERQS